MIVLVLLAIISFAALRGGINKASNHLGGGVEDMVKKSSASSTEALGETTQPHASLNWAPPTEPTE